MINIVCVLRTGGKIGYDASWVEKLKNSVTRNLTIPHNFLCLSDCNVPCDRIPLDNIGDGYWAKLQLFKPGLFNGPVFYLDLDTVICQNIDNIIDKVLQQSDFLMWRDDAFKLSSSALMFWNGDYSTIYQQYIKNPEFYHNQFSPSNQGISRLIGDQAVISSIVNHKFINDLCPKNWIKVIEKRPMTVDHSDTKILIFRKAHSKPSTMLEHKLVKDHWK